MMTPDAGDAWRYADPARLADPATTQALLQAALSALLTVRHIRTSVDAEDERTAIDWQRVERELQAALKLAGHPAGDTPQ